MLCLVSSGVVIAFAIKSFLVLVCGLADAAKNGQMRSTAWTSRALRRDVNWLIGPSKC